MLRRRIAVAFIVAAVSCSGTQDVDGRGGTLTLGTPANGTLTTADNAAPPDHTMPYSADVWTLSLTAGQPVSIVMCASNANLDPFLGLYLNGTRVAADDDGAGNRGSLIQFTPTQTGTYQVWAQDCCTEPVADDGLDRGYTIEAVAGSVTLACDTMGIAGMDGDGGDDGGSDAAAE